MCSIIGYLGSSISAQDLRAGFDGAPTEALARSGCSSGVFFTQALLCGSHRPALAGNDRPCYFSPSMLLTEV